MIPGLPYRACHSVMRFWGTGSVEWKSVSVSDLRRVLNPEKLMERETLCQNPYSHRWDTTCRKMPPDTIMPNPVDLQALLESPGRLCLHIGSPPVGRTPAAQRGVEGFQMVRVHGPGFKSLYCLRMLRIRGVIWRTFGPALMSWRPLMLQPPFAPWAPRFLWAPPLARPSGFAAPLKQEPPLASLALGPQRQSACLLDDVTPETHRLLQHLAVLAAPLPVPHTT